MLNKTAAGDLAQKFKIDVFTVYREYLQLLFLKNIYALKKSGRLFFKGGTAVRFLLGGFRFSEDLDFTAGLSREETAGLVLGAVNSLNKEVEIQFKPEKDFPQSYSGKIYQRLDEFNFPLTIKVEISLREEVFSSDTRYIETVFPLSPYPLAVVMGFEEMLAEKIRALLTRNKGRDIFDLWFFLSKGVKINWELVNKKMALYQKTAGFKDLENAVVDFSDKELEGDLKRFLPLDQRKVVKEIKALALESLRKTQSD